MSHELFESYFHGAAREFLCNAIDAALSEDGPDLTSWGVFAPEDAMTARIVAKSRCVICGLPLIPLVLDRLARRLEAEFPEKAASFSPYTLDIVAREGAEAKPGDRVASFRGPAILLLGAERVILNFMTHLSGIATLTRQYARAMERAAAPAAPATRLLDTRKTLPGLRYPEKYAVLAGGGRSHRHNLHEMLMLKDNHIDRAGGIEPAVRAVRAAWSPCPPIEVECRALEDVREAVRLGVDRVMLDNMSLDAMREALALIPESVESEISGGVALDNIGELAALGADFISVGRLTHSAAAADLSMSVVLNDHPVE